MLRVLQINSCVNGSTGTIMKTLQKYVSEKGGECVTATRMDYSKLSLTPQKHIFIGGLVSKHIDSWMAFHTGKEGAYSYLSTKKLLHEVDKYNPDVIHMHNLHANYINISMLFDYFRNHTNIKVIWTLHDCWAFTGHCPYFDMVACEKWKTGCCKCELYSEYPACKKDNSEYMYLTKKKIFTGIDNLVIVTPSKWLAELVKKSFLKEYTLDIINNGIDTAIFKPQKSSVLQKKYKITSNKKIVLGVASGWEARKGLDTFARLASELKDVVEIVLVGVNQQIKEILPSNVICIERTENQKELASIYSESDVFVNPTMEENYPTVNIEAICCGTPVITYATGGAGEIIQSDCGIVVSSGNYEELKKKILEIPRKKIDENRLKNIRDYFDWKRMAEEYFNLYEK